MWMRSSIKFMHDEPKLISNMIGEHVLTLWNHQTTPFRDSRTQHTTTAAKVATNNHIMSIPPQILRIKRKADEDPVDALCRWSCACRSGAIANHIKISTKGERRRTTSRQSKILCLEESYRPRETLPASRRSIKTRQMALQVSQTAFRSSLRLDQAKKMSSSHDIDKAGRQQRAPNLTRIMYRQDIQYRCNQ